MEKKIMDELAKRTQQAMHKGSNELRIQVLEDAVVKLTKELDELKKGKSEKVQKKRELLKG